MENSPQNSQHPRNEGLLKSCKPLGQSLHQYCKISFTFFLAAAVLRLTKAKLVWIGGGGGYLRESAECKCALHLTDMIIQNGLRAESLCQLKAIDDFERLANRLRE